jgi:hypothetical protein
MPTAALDASQDHVVDELLGAYRVMRTIREFEDRVSKHFALGDVPGFNCGPRTTSFRRTEDMGTRSPRGAMSTG